MSDIQFPINEYNLEVSLIKEVVTSMDFFLNKYISMGDSTSNAIDSFNDIYYLMRNVIKSYKWLLDIGVASLENASTILSETDMNAAEGI